MNLGTQDKEFFPVTLIEKFKFVKSLGFDSFEIDGKVLLEQFEELKEAIKESGLPVTTACGGYRGWIGDFIEERRKNGIDDLKRLLKNISEIGGTGVVVPAAWGMFTYRLPPCIAPRTKEGDTEALLDSLSQLDVVAKEYGVYLYLEPLNRYQDHMLNTAKDAVDLIKMGGFTNVKLTYDFYHMAIEEDDMAKTIELYKDYIGHVHIAENHRFQPGTGTMDFEKLIRTLDECGYKGPLTNEGRVRGENQLEAYIESVQYVKQYL